MAHLRDYTALQDDMRQLAELVAIMGGVIEKNFDNAIDALSRLDRDAARQIIDSDDEVNSLENEISDLAARALARHQGGPDMLREVIGTVRIASDLEKIGDLVKGIATRTLALLNEAGQPQELVAGLQHLSEITMAQLKSAIDAYIERDLAKAEQAHRTDDDIDSLYTALFQALLEQMTQDSRSIKPCTHLLFCAKNIERIGDHATDIAGSMRYFLGARTAPRSKGFLR